jgi:hypothetical protein
MARYDTTGRDKINPDPVLTQISIEFEQSTTLVSQRFFPTVTVGARSGRYSVFGRKAWRRTLTGDVRAPGARANEREGQVKQAEDTYFCNEHALEEVIPVEEREENPERNVEGEAAEDITWDLLLGKELVARELLYDTTQYHTGHVVTLGAGEYFDVYATSDPITVFRDLMRTFHETLGILPNLAMVPWKAMSYLEDHPAIVERYAQNGGIITPQQIATILGLQEIVVPGTVYNGENPGQAAVLSELWGNNIVLGVVPPRPARNTPALGYEFLQPISSGRNVEGNVSIDVREDEDRVSDIVRGRRRYDLKLVGRDPDLDNKLVAGALIVNAVTPA